jgi:nitrate reductase gamma subunit
MDALLTKPDTVLGTDVALSPDDVEGRLVLPDLPARWKGPLKRTAKELHGQLSLFKDFLSVTLLWHIAHSGLLVHSYASDTAVQKCMIFSWSTIVSSLLMLVLTIAVLIYRSVAGKLPTAVEQGYDIASILFGVFISSSAGTFDWVDSTPITEVCSSLRQPVSGMAMYFGDISGLISLLRSILLVAGRPYQCSDRSLGVAGSVLTVLVVSITAQLTLLDLLLVPALAGAVRRGEENGDPLDFLDGLFGLNGTGVA